MHKKVNGKRVPCEGLPRFIDGGVRYNFPVTAFDQRRFIKSNLDGSDPQKPKFNKRTLGICLYSSTQPKIPQNVGEQCLSIISNIGASDTEWQVNPGLRRRIIEINDQGVGTLEFGLDGEKKGKLIEAGRKAKYAFSQADILRVLDRSNDESVVRQCLDLADSSYVRGDFAGALKLYTRAREIEEPFGPEAQSIGALFFNEALCLANQGSFREAYEFYEKACKILSKLHKDTTQIELGMARCCAHLALYDAANDYYSLALSKLGEQAHSRPDVMKFSLAMADSYLKEKKYVDALGFYDKAYKFMKKIHGDSHPHLVVPMFGMVQCYVEQREYAEALKLCPGLLKVSDAAVKSEHALTAMHCLAFMGDCEWKYKEHGYHSYEHRQNALILYKKALDCGIAVLGKTDPLISILQDIHNVREIRMYMNIASSQTVHHRGFGRG